MTTTAEATTVESPPPTCPEWCSGRPDHLDGDDRHMGEQRLVHLSLVEPVTGMDPFTGCQVWHTPKVGVQVFANRNVQFPYVSLAVGEKAGQEVEMSFFEAADLIDALTLATREIYATVLQVAAQEREVQS